MLKTMSLIFDREFYVIFSISFCIFIIYKIYCYLQDRKQILKAQENFKNIDDYNSEFTIEELSKYNGKNGKPNYVAVKNIIFDVNSYKEDGSYANFAGKEISIALAKMDTKLTNICYESEKDKLSLDEISSLNGWHMRFENQYQVVGKIVSDSNKKNK